jgi:hypothetical protein
MSCDLGIVTASRDKTIKLWAEDGTEFMCLHTFVRFASRGSALLA